MSATHRLIVTSEGPISAEPVEEKDGVVYYRCFCGKGLLHEYTVEDYDTSLDDADPDWGELQTFSRIGIDCPECRKRFKTAFRTTEGFEFLRAEWIEE